MEKHAKKNQIKHHEKKKWGVLFASCFCSNCKLQLAVI